MEYMLLLDGTVKVFNRIATSTEVLTALYENDGAAYYWRDSSAIWYMLTPISVPGSIAQTTADAVPDIIKLAAMME